MKMAHFETGDGRMASFPVDDDTTPEQALATYNQEMARLQQPEHEDMGVGESIWTGIKTPFQEARYGLEQAAGTMDADDEEALRQVRADRERAGHWGTVGEVGSWLIPGGYIAKGAAKAATMLPRALGMVSPTAAVVAGEGAAQGAYEGMRVSIDDDPSRGQRALSGAEWGLGGGMAGHAVGRTLKRTLGTGLLKRSAEADRIAERMGAQGLNPETMTLGQQVGGGIGNVENALLHMPAIGQSAARNRGLAEMNRLRMNEAVPIDTLTGDKFGTITEPGREGFRQLAKVYNDIYSAATIGKTVTPTPGFNRQYNDLAASVEAEVRNTGTRATILDELTEMKLQIDEGRVTGDEIKRFDGDLNELIRKATKGENATAAAKRKYGEFKEIYRTLRNDSVGPDAARDIEAADKVYGEVKSLQGAGSMKGARKRDLFAVDQMDAGETLGKTRAQKARGYGQDRTHDEYAVYGTTLPETGPGTAEKLVTHGMLVGGAATVGMLPQAATAYAARKALETAPVKRALTGRAARQPMLARSLGALDRDLIVTGAALPQHE